MRNLRRRDRSGGSDLRIRGSPRRGRRRRRPTRGYLLEGSSRLGSGVGRTQASDRNDRRSGHRCHGAGDDRPAVAGCDPRRTAAVPGEDGWPVSVPFRQTLMALTRSDRRQPLGEPRCRSRCCRPLGRRGLRVGPVDRPTEIQTGPWFYEAEAW